MKRVLKLSLAATLFGQMAFAQSPPPTQPSGSAPGPTVSPSATAPADVNMAAPKQAQLSPAEMMQQAQEYRVRITETLSKLGGYAENARRDKDIIRLNCLMNKVAEVKANEAVANQAMTALQDANARNEEGAATHEFTRMTIVNQKVQLLAAEAEACVGEDLTFVGQTRVDVEITGNLPDGVTDPNGPRPTVERPPLASPYM